MMTVKDYAVDVKKSINEVLDKCIELGISAFNENDELTEENIIDLDNNLNFDEEEDIVEEIVEELANKSLLLNKSISIYIIYIKFLLNLL